MNNYQTNEFGNRSASCCQQVRRNCGCVCSVKVICFFVVALAAALGLIFGAVYAEQILTALAAVIVFAVVMAVAIIALLIYRWCERC